MVIVHVKHYLTPAGMSFFDKWFAEVKHHISKQKGFCSITFEKQKDSDLVYIIVKFETQEALDDWVAVDIHDDLVNKLDAFRSRNYWEAARTDNEETTPLEWKQIKPAT